MTQAELYRASVAPRLKNMSWAEFSGSTISVSDANLASDISESASGFGGVGEYTVVSGANSATTPGFQLIPTAGPVLVLNFAEVIQLTEDYYAPGSLGSFNLQLQVLFENNHH